MRRDAPGAEIIQMRQRMQRWRGFSVITGMMAACLVGIVLVREYSPNSLPPDDRSPTNGFRCIRAIAPEPNLARLQGQLLVGVRRELVRARDRWDRHDVSSPFFEWVLASPSHEEPQLHP